MNTPTTPNGSPAKNATLPAALIAACEKLLVRASLERPGRNRRHWPAVAGLNGQLLATKCHTARVVDGVETARIERPARWW